MTIINCAVLVSQKEVLMLSLLCLLCKAVQFIQHLFFLPPVWLCPSPFLSLSPMQFLRVVALLLLLYFPSFPSPATPCATCPAGPGSRGAVSISQSVHAEVFLRRRAALTARPRRLSSPSVQTPLFNRCRVFSVFDPVCFLQFFSTIYLFAPRTVGSGADTLYVDLLSSSHRHALW